MNVDRTDAMGENPSRKTNAQEPAHRHTKPADARLQALRKHERAYEELAAQMKALLDNVHLAYKVDAAQAKKLREGILQYHETVGSALFDVLQLVRVGANYYSYHALNVPLLSLSIGKALQLDSHSMPLLVNIGMLMDVGMLAMPTHVLDGRAKLQPAELAMVRNHANFSVSLLEKSGFGADATLLESIAAHHERFNGTGYPAGLSGHAIPLQARVIAVADSFDAATARRHYRHGKSPFAILQELAQGENGGQDPMVAKAAATALAQMLLNRFVVLSDHSVGQVLEYFPDNLAYPLVRVLGKRIQTGPELFPVALSSQVRLF